MRFDANGGSDRRKAAMLGLFEESIIDGLQSFAGNACLLFSTVRRK
jgi:hypothetical protein